MSRITIQSIKHEVIRFYQLDEREFHSAMRKRRIARPRQIAMALARRLTNCSLPEIGRHFGGRDHTTVLHACNHIKVMLANDPEFRMEFDSIHARIGAGNLVLNDWDDILQIFTSIERFCRGLAGPIAIALSMQHDSFRQFHELARAVNALERFARAFAGAWKIVEKRRQIRSNSLAPIPARGAATAGGGNPSPAPGAFAPP